MSNIDFGKKLRKSPFKVDKSEKDPNAFGLRTTEIEVCASTLYNNRNILISGPRGIGKSSLGEQLLVALGGEHTLLSDAKFLQSSLKHFAYIMRVALA
jgi:MoxR-like ATPase